MNYQDFIYEYIFLFCYVYSIVLIRMTHYVYIGWWLLFIVHFAFTGYYISSNIFRFSEPTFYIMLANCILVFVSLYFIVTKLSKYNRPDPSTSNYEKILLVPTNKQRILDEFLRFIIANVVIIYFVMLIFKTKVQKYILPIGNDRKYDYTLSRIHFVHTGQYTYFWEYLIPWLSGLSQMALLGISGYIMFLGNDF